MLFKFKLNKQFLFILLTILSAYLISNEIMGDILFDDNVVQDDFRQSSFWVWRFWDSELFQKSFFTEMYIGHLYRTPLLFLIYRSAPFFTDNLVFFSKLLAFIIAVFSSLMAYLYMEKLQKDKLIAFAFAFTVIITIWCTDHTSAACARSFIWLGIFSYLYYKHQKKNLLASIVIFLNLMLSPITFLICLGMEGFDYLKTYKTRIIQFKSIQFWSLLINCFLMLLIYLVVFKDMNIQGVGELLTVEEMKKLPEFNAGGRLPIFNTENFSWWASEHWGAGFAYLPIGRLVIYVAILLALYTFVNFHNLDFKFIANSSPALLFYSASSLHIIAYVTYPLIYLPSRYVAVPLLILSLILLSLILKQVINSIPWISKNREIYYLFIFIFLLFFYMHFKTSYHPRFVKIHPALRNLLLQLPKDSVIAGHPMSQGINTATITAKRVVFIDSERSMAYSQQSLNEIRRRNIVALNIFYAEDKETILKLMEENGITHIYVDGIFYSPKYLRNPFYMEPYNQVLKSLVATNKFYLRRLLVEQNSQAMILNREGIAKSETR